MEQGANQTPPLPMMMMMMTFICFSSSFINSLPQLRVAVYLPELFWGYQSYSSNHVQDMQCYWLKLVFVLPLTLCLPTIHCQQRNESLCNVISCISSRIIQYTNLVVAFVPRRLFLFRTRHSFRLGRYSWMDWRKNFLCFRTNAIQSNSPKYLAF